MADQAIVFYKCLASEKMNEYYAVVMGLIRCRLSLSLLLAIRCLCGSCSFAGRFICDNPVATADLIQAETGLSPLHNC